MGLLRYQPAMNFGEKHQIAGSSMMLDSVRVGYNHARFIGYAEAATSRSANC